MPPVDWTSLQRNAARGNISRTLGARGGFWANETTHERKHPIAREKKPLVPRVHFLMTIQLKGLWHASAHVQHLD